MKFYDVFIFEDVGKTDALIGKFAAGTGNACFFDAQREAFENLFCCVSDVRFLGEDDGDD